MPRNNLWWKYVTEIPYLHDIQYTIEIQENTQQTKYYLPLYIIRMLYFSMANSHLNCGILIAGFAPTRLVKILNHRIMRTMTCCKYNAQTEPLLKLMVVLMLKDLLNINAIKFYYKYLQKTLPSCFYSSNITTQGDNHFHNTRESEQTRTKRTRTQFADNNNNNKRIYLPPIIKSAPITLLQKITTHSIYGFSSNVKGYLFEDYCNAYSIPNCY